MDRIKQSYAILDKLRLENGMYLASPSEDYSYVWIRDSFYESLPYLNKNDGVYEKTYHRMLDLFKEYEWKIKYHTKHKPTEMWQYIHARYSADDVKEIDMPWGHAQHDSIGAVLFGIAKGVEFGKNIIRDDKDLEIIQMLIDYLNCCEYWRDPDNGMWEENREIHSSSVGAVVAGLKAIKKHVASINVPQLMISLGEQTLKSLFPMESKTKPVDLAQLSLIYPYAIYRGHEAKIIIKRVEAMLLRSSGVIRYQGDSYYSTHPSGDRNLSEYEYYGHEAEWTFGLPWLALCHLSVRSSRHKVGRYLDEAEGVMLEDGSLPELYLANSSEYNGNTPLGWSNAMYILAAEQLMSRDKINRALTRALNSKY